MRTKNIKKDVFKDVIDQTIEAIGGIDNIEDIFHCATRLRITLKDVNIINKEKINNIDKSKGFSQEKNQLQIIFGTGIVNKVFDKYKSIYSTNDKTFQEKNKNNSFKWNHNYSFKTNSFLLIRHSIRNFAEIFIPLIPLFIIGGLSLAINSLINTENIGGFKDSTGKLQLTNAAIIFSKLFDTIGGAIMGSLPVFIGFTSAKKWGGNKWFGAAMGLILIAPSLVNSYSLGSSNIIWYEIWNKPENIVEGATYIPILWDNGVRVFNYPLFGIPLMGYQAQIIPTLLVIGIMVWIEKGLKKISHESFAIISVPLLTIVFTTIIAFVIVGPFGYVISLSIAEALKAIFIYTNFPYFGLGGAILGALYAPIVITGLHQGFLPIEATLLAQVGESWITPIACVSNISQAFACLSAAIFIKDKKLKGTAYSGSLSANLGITEPAMFGINISVKHYFLGAIIGSAVGGYWLGMTQTVANSLGSASWIGLLQFDVTTSSPNLIAWYQQVATITPWGKYMNGFNIPPIANAAIAMTMSAIIAFIASSLLSVTKNGIKNLSEVNKEEGNYLFVSKFGSIVGNFQNKTIEFFGNLFYGKNKYKNKKIEKQIAYIYSPIDGEIINSKNINDEVFKNNILGTTIAIKPIQDQYNLHSPLKGTISNIFETGHAITISNKLNNSLLIHIGLETAKLNIDSKNLKTLKYFNYKKLILSKVSKNSIILEVNSKELIENKAKSNDLFLVLLNESIKSNQIVEIIKTEGQVKIGEPIMKIVSQ